LYEYEEFWTAMSPTPQQSQLAGAGVRWNVGFRANPMIRWRGDEGQLRVDYGRRLATAGAAAVRSKPVMGKDPGNWVSAVVLSLGPFAPALKL
jgi:hypothetical protein